MVLFGLSSIVLTGVLSGTTYAAASDCSYAYGDIACFWMDVNFTNLRTDYYAPTLEGCYGFSSTFNDQVSSLANRSSHYMLIYINGGCNSNTSRVQQVSPWTNWSSMPSTWNDQISSFKLTDHPIW